MEAKTEELDWALRTIDDDALSLPLLPQTQSWEDVPGDSDADDANDNDDAGGVQEENGESTDPANGSNLFEVDENGEAGGQDDDSNDGFDLMTQTNEHFKGNTSNDGDSDSSESSGSSSSSTSSDDEGSDSDSPPEKANPDIGASLTEKRERNIRRNDAFVKSFKEDLQAIMSNGQSGGLRGKQILKQKPELAQNEKNSKSPEKVVDGTEAEETSVRKKKGMIFTPPTNNPHEASSNDTPSAADLPLTTKSLVDELVPKYPHRTKQIHLICSQIMSIVHKSKFAWQMTDNAMSAGNIQYSEASYQGDTKLAAPSPILITGPGGSGKTCIVRDAMRAVSSRTNGGSKGGMQPNVADAYVDCASSQSFSVAAVMNSAYMQFYKCYHPSSGSVHHGKVGGKGHTKVSKKNKHYISEIDPSALGNDDFEGDCEDDAEDEHAEAEDLLERQRKRKWKDTTAKKTEKEVSAKKQTNKLPKNGGRQTRLQTKAATESAPTPEKRTGLKASTQIATQNNSSAALFGRAISGLLQGSTLKRRSPQNWRCAFLILDHAERILSWKKQGSINPLTQILMLPSVMGINLTLIFISRSTIFQYSPVHNRSGSVLDAVHPQKIHFNSYTSVDMIKSILHVAHVRKSIMGCPTTVRHTFSCNIANKVRSLLNDLLYASMINSFVPSIKSSTQDITEIMRLARLLWTEFVAPLERDCDSNDSSVKASIMEVLGCLRRDAALSNKLCHDPNCSFCQYFSPEAECAKGMGIDLLKQRLCEKLDKKIRERMRDLISSTAMMPGRVLQNKKSEPYAKSLPYTTKFLLLAAYLCQNKRPEQDVNLFTTKNTGKSKRKRSNASDGGSAFVSSRKELKQRQPSFPLERLLSVFYSIIGQYGQHFMVYKEEGVSTVAQLGTERLFQSVSQLIEIGMLSSAGNVKFNDKFNHDLMEIMSSAKFSCTFSRNDARVIASSVGFPLEKYCP